MGDGLIFLLSVLSGALFTFLARWFAWRYNIVNKPNAIVPQHKKPIAYLGGVGVYLGIAVATFLLFYREGEQFPWDFLLIGFLFMVLGCVDDLKEFSPKLKFLLQVVLAVLATALGIYYQFTGIAIIDMVLSGFIILVLVNACNLTDVCDGLVGGLSMIALLAIFFTGAYSGVLPFICSGALLGFLFFNAPSASIFLGDAGSHLLGFILAYFLFQHTLGKSIIEGFLPVLLVSGVFLFELFFLIIVRKRKGLKWWLGSPDHFSLRLQAIGFSKWRTDFIAYTLGALCALPLILTQTCDQPISILVLAIGFVLLMFLLFANYLLRKERLAS